MKILHVTDSHGTVKGPDSRRDIYYIAFLKKLYELGYIVKKQNISVVVHTGDLFHTARVSDKFAGQVSEMIKAMGVPFYVVPGNHDIEGYTIDTIDQTKLGLLAKTGVINILDRDHPVKLHYKQNGVEYTIGISGQEYYAHIDEGNPDDFDMQQDEQDLNILAIHGYLADTPQHPDIKCTMCSDIISNADIILTGHYHRQFEWTDGQNLNVFNPGSMMRVEQTDYNKNHIPQYGILDIFAQGNTLCWDYNFHQFRIAEPSTTVFDYNSKYKAKAAAISLDGFKNSIANTMSSIQPTNNLLQIINDICSNNNIPVNNPVYKYAEDAYNNALQSLPDEFEAPSGFIEGHIQKKISSVEIKNFQSHADTKVDFDDGLNIIVGESNNGKTSILRAIMWVIDNQPLGTDFIMAGEDECTVRITYTDGTYIERGRTLKDTGYYKIRYMDENGQLQDQTYRGFTNAVPVEVANVHQMPKVSITKDIETHLNVLSQLDGPFLLTESPLVKASAIGRITGTHVIDAAIKESNKTIQSNKKTIKSYEADIEEKNNDIKALPDINLMSTFSDMYSAIVAKLEDLDSEIQNIAQQVSEIKYTDVMIQQNQDTYNQCMVYVSLGNYVKAAFDKLNTVVRIQNNVDAQTDTVREIFNQEMVIKQCNIFKELKPSIEYSSNLQSFINTVSSKLNDYNQLDNNITNLFNQNSLSKEYNKTLNDILVHCDILHQYVTKVQPIIDEIESADNNQKELVDNIASYKKNITTIKSNIKKTEKEKSDFILSNGLCPCCGQPVNDSHVESISAFIGGLS